MPSDRIQHFKSSERSFEHFGGPPGHADIARLVGPELSRTMGAGVARFDGCSIEWTVLYDELVVVLEGTFRLREGEETYTCAAGDVLWIPENTPLRYEGEKSTVFYAVYPVDWRQRHGKA